MAIVKDSILPYTTLRTDLMSTSAQTVWLQIDLPNQTPTVVGFLYREWLDTSGQRNTLSTLTEQIDMATETKGHIIVMGDLNLDQNKWDCLLYTSPSPRDQRGSRMPSSA